jgi:methyltransferase-like protein 6
MNLFRVDYIVAKRRKSLFSVFLASNVFDFYSDEFVQKSSKSWNVFYAHNKQNFFKDRAYLWREFPELNPELTPAPLGEIKPVDKRRVLEVGCGVGNSIWPLVDLHPDKYFIGFDCSANAVKLLQTHAKYNEETTCKAFVTDIAETAIPAEEIADKSIDLVTLIFMLSAIPPEKHRDVLQRLRRVLKPNATILFRDYGLYDLTQMRFFSKKTSKLSENLYKRGDGTLTFFFSKGSCRPPRRTDMIFFIDACVFYIV